MDDRQRMRASDRDRQEVVDRLREAVAEGRLKMDEYMDRMGRAYQAVTRRDPARPAVPRAAPAVGEGLIQHGGTGRPPSYGPRTVLRCAALTVPAALCRRATCRALPQVRGPVLPTGRCAGDLPSRPLRT